MHAEQQQPQNQTPHSRVPELLTLDEVATLLRRSKATILADMSDGPRGRPDRVPPGGFHHGSQWLWYAQDVADFLEAKRSAALARDRARLIARQTGVVPPRKRRGAPTKAERISRGAA